MYKRKAEPDGFCIYRGAMKTLRLLPDEKAGRVIKAAVSLFLEGVEPEELDLAEQMAFAVIEEDIKKALEKHAAICDRNRKNRNSGNRLSFMRLILVFLVIGDIKTGTLSKKKYGIISLPQLGSASG